MTIRMRATWWAVLGLLAATAQAAPPAAVAPPEGVTFTELERAEGLAIAGHPNELWRVRALRALKLGQADRAVEASRVDVPETRVPRIREALESHRAGRCGGDKPQHGLNRHVRVGVAVQHEQGYAEFGSARDRVEPIQVDRRPAAGEAHADRVRQQAERE